MRDRAILLAIGLVCATNAGALALAAWNRSSATSSMTLTEREMRLSRGTASISQLRIDWAQPAALALDADQAARAGFRTAVAPDATDAYEYYRRQLPRQAYVALEYDGPAWQSYRDGMLRRDVPGAPMLSPSVLREQREAMTRAIEGSTRLIAVAVDGDADRLRAAFPELSRYLIARARVSVALEFDARRRPILSSHVVELLPSAVNVPRPFSTALRELTSNAAYRYTEALDAPPRFVVDLKYGRSHEPWIVGVRRPPR